MNVRPTPLTVPGTSGDQPLRRRILFVDDEPSIRETLPAVLRLHGFEVTACANVPEALSHIQAHVYDVLISDLNIGEPGDGFTLVSAMRRVQPKAVTIIITGYPEFETALRAIRSQVDDYVVKPTRTEDLIATIEQKIQARHPHEPMQAMPVSGVLAAHKSSVQRTWLERVRTDREIKSLQLDDEQQLDHLPFVLDELVAGLEVRRMDLTPESLTSARKHGRTRRVQRYTLPMMLRETRYLRQTLYYTLEQHLLDIDLSRWMSDMMLLNDLLDAFLNESVSAFLAQ